MICFEDVWKLIFTFYLIKRRLLNRLLLHSLLQGWPTYLRSTCWPPLVYCITQIVMKLHKPWNCSINIFKWPLLGLKIIFKALYFRIKLNVLKKMQVRKNFFNDNCVTTNILSLWSFIHYLVIVKRFQSVVCLLCWLFQTVSLT